VRLTREATRITVLGAGLLLASLVSAAAQDPHSEIFTGLEASNNAISGYLGAGYAFGKGLYERGWRVRAVGALGRYDYRGTLFGAGADLGTTFDGEASYGAALMGYQFRTQALFLKLFAGVEAEDQSITPRDPENSVQGSATGPSSQRKAGSTFRRCGSSPSMPPTGPRFSNIGAWRGRAIAFRHASLSGSRAARSATRNTTRAVAAAS
jgi:hypothetical protein